MHSILVVLVRIRGGLKAWRDGLNTLGLIFVMSWELSLEGSSKLLELGPRVLNKKIATRQESFAASAHDMLFDRGSFTTCTLSKGTP
ncbi:hypothetical protein Pyn_33254 [Prunus yedoensis var. nudiflora]|uniref:Uncharacterized protein n=1 Tax=Prunus yedoensis var. nudiflora TaxID=2094558 RepID=A0A314YAZ2_PRUYE|nr:hypothetical protein Pyn_33254 [Prunus yedoensis var. nudiflora]